MTFERICKITPKFSNEEEKAIRDTLKILKNIETEMISTRCDIIECRGEYTYDLRDLKETIGDLEMYLDITEIFA